MILLFSREKQDSRILSVNLSQFKGQFITGFLGKDYSSHLSLKKDLSEKNLVLSEIHFLPDNNINNEFGFSDIEDFLKKSSLIERSMNIYINIRLKDFRPGKLILEFMKMYRLSKSAGVSIRYKFGLS